jgi:hypothetical protein
LSGSLSLSDGSSNTTTIAVAPTSGNYTVTVPSTNSNDTFCLLNLGNCAVNGGGSTNFAQGGNGFGATAVLGTADNNSLQFITNNQSALTIASGGAITARNNTNSVSAFRVEKSSSLRVFEVDTVSNVVSVGDGTVSSSPGFLNVANLSYDISNRNGASIQLNTGTGGGATVSGVSSVVDVAPTFAATGFFTGVSGKVTANNLNTSGASVIGISGAVFADDFNATGDVTIDYAVGGDFLIGSYGGNNGTSTINNAYGVRIAQFDNSFSGGVINKAAGIAIAPQTLAFNNTNLLIGATSIPSGNFSIYNSSTDNNVFAGKLRVGSTVAPTVALDVTGSAAISVNLTVNGYTTVKDLAVGNKLKLGAQTLTLTDDGVANDILTPTSSYIRVDVNETANAGVPDLIISELGAVDGDTLTVVNNEQDGTSDTFTITNLAGVVHTPGAVVITLGPNDSIAFIYMNDRWVTTSQSNN